MAAPSSSLARVEAFEALDAVCAEIIRNGTAVHHVQAALIDVVAATLSERPHGSSWTLVAESTHGYRFTGHFEPTSRDDAN